MGGLPTLLWGTAAGRIVNCVEAYLLLSDEGTAWWPSPFGDHDELGRPDDENRRPGLRPMVAYWMHTGLRTTTDAKMSKSVGNLVTIRDALATASARAIRFVFLSSHYRSSMELTDDTSPGPRGRSTGSTGSSRATRTLTLDA
jgi:hypothetical protein